MTSHDEHVQARLDELAADLVRRGFHELTEFAVDGRTAGLRTSTIILIGWSGGRFRAHYRDQGELSLLAESHDPDQVEAAVVEALERERAAFRARQERWT